MSNMKWYMVIALVTSCMMLPMHQRQYALTADQLLAALLGNAVWQRVERDLRETVHIITINKYEKILTEALEKITGEYTQAVRNKVDELLVVAKDRKSSLDVKVHVCARS